MIFHMRRSLATFVVVALLATFIPASLAAPDSAYASTTANLKAVHFLDANTGFAVGSGGTIAKTSDGGTTWSVVRSGGTLDFRGVDFWSATSGIAVDYTGIVVGTSDGGASWTDLNYEPFDIDGESYDSGFNDVAALPGSAQTAFAVGGTMPGDGLDVGEQVWRTVIGGTYWGGSPVLEAKNYLEKVGDEDVYVGEGEFLDVDFVSATVGWVVGVDLYRSAAKTADAPTLYSTADGGTNWTRRTTEFGANARLTGVSFGTTSAGIVVGTSLDSATLGQPRVYYTTDGGTTWTAGTLPGGTGALEAVYMSSASNAWAVGTGGTLIRTTDGGATWTVCTKPAGFSTSLRDVTFVGLNGWAVGDSGAILRTTDGATWTAPAPADMAPPTITSLTSSTHANESTWYAASTATLSWSATDPSGVAGYSYVRDTSPSTVPPQTNLGTQTTITYNSLPDGVHYFHLRAVDTPGNWSATSRRAIRVDVTNPTCAPNPAVQPTYTGSAQIALQGSDTHSGVHYIEWRLNGGAIQQQTGGSATVNVSAPGSYTLQYRAVDNAGNAPTSWGSASFTVVASTSLTVTPIQGDNRYTTAIEASKKAFPAGSVTTVVIATGANWPDALGGAALAGAAKGPILLTAPNALPAEVLTEIDRLGATKAYILGGTPAVSSAVETNLKNKLGAGNVTRLGGADRYATARLIAAEAVRLLEASPAGYDGTAFIATGLNFPDALGASPLAAAKGWPIYLSNPGQGDNAALIATMKTDGATKAIVLGGTNVVASSIETKARTTLGTAQRLRGDTRYDTAVAIATYGVNSAGLSWNKVAVATGANFPDALAGGVLQGKDGSVMLLTPPTVLNGNVKTTLTANKATIQEVRFLGGTSAVSTGVRTEVINALK